MERKSKSSKKCQTLALETFSSDSFLSINKRLLSYFGPNVTIFLCNLIDKYKYFIEEEKLQEDGSFFLTHLDQTAQTGMSEYELRKCKKILKKEKILNTYMSGIPPKEFYILNIDTLVDNFLRNIPLNFKGIRIKNSKEKDSKIQRNIKDNKYKDNKLKESSSSDGEKSQENSQPKSNKNGYITPGQFERFWKMYPKKVRKGDAKRKWNDICTQKSWQKDRPKWKTIALALAEQKKSEQWQNPKYIPHAVTWLNKFKWLDDPSQMKSFDKKETDGIKPEVAKHISYRDPNKKYST